MIFYKYLTNTFDSESKSTVGVEFGSKNFNIEGNDVKVQIWDTAGQERYKSITSAYYKGCLGAFLVYDITNKKTFESIDKWMIDIKNSGEQNMTILLIGNKSDLESSRQVSIEEGNKKAEQYNIAFIETSALNGSNIEKAFDLMVREVYNNFHNTFIKDAKVELGGGLNMDIDMGTENEREKKEEKCCINL